MSITLFFRKMPWKAPYVRDGKGASSGEVVEGSGGKADEGKLGNLIANVSKQSQAKGRELQKKKPRKTLPMKIPKTKPTIDGLVFSQSPNPVKKIKFGGKNVKPSNFMSEGEEDEEDEGVERGEEKEDQIADLGHLLHHLVSLLGDLVDIHARCTLPSWNNTRRLVQ